MASGAACLGLLAAAGVWLGQRLAMGPVWPLALACGLATAGLALALGLGLVRRPANPEPRQDDKALIGALQLEVDRGRLTKEALAESEARYRSLFHDSHQVMLLIDPATGRIRDANPAACRYYGRHWTDLAAMNMDQIATDGWRDDGAGLGGRVLALHRLADGQQRRVEVHRSPIPAVGLVHAIVHDITDKTRTEQALVESERKLGAIVDAVGEAMIMFDRELAVSWANEEAADLLDSGEARSVAVDLARACLADGLPHELERGLSAADGRQTHVWATARPLEAGGDGPPETVLVMLRDITAKKALEAEAAMASHLASIGELAAGVAHEINNPINGVINLAQLIIDRAGSAQAANDYPRLIIQEGERISAIVRNLLSFARPQREDPTAVSLAAALDDALALMGSQLRKRAIDLRLDLPADLPPVLGRHHGLQQVFMNIISNAQHALDQRFPDGDPEKILAIRAEARLYDGRRWVRLRFADHGVGIDPEGIKRVFQPFFSTKPAGQGTGLGLSVSHGIVRDHGGRIAMESQPGQGATVIVDLPAAGEGEA